MKKILRRILYVIIILIVVISVSCVGFLTMMPTSQSLHQRIDRFPVTSLPLDQSAEIYWSEHLIPFIEAQTDHDAAFLLGMVHAHLRLGQMSLIRRVGQGRFAESAGPLVAKVDQTIRILNFGEAIDSIKMILPDETRKWLSDYKDGINFYQSRNPQRPIEMKLLGIEYEDWTVDDILLIGRLIGIDINWMNWFQWLPLQGKPFYHELWNRYVDIGCNSSPSFKVMTSPTDEIMLASARTGSNAFVLSDKMTTDHSAYLVSDPHLGLTIPNTWIIGGYKSPSFHVIGLMFPGIPMVLLGRNPAIAWGGTNMRSASSDLYRVKEEHEAIESHQEIVKVRWWSDRTITVRKSELGPIITDSPLIETTDDRILAMRWVGHQPSDEFTTFLRVNQAENWDEFVRAFDSYAVSGQNFLYADTSGNIGMVLAVRIPNRVYSSPDSLVLNPDLPAHQWYGLTNATELPKTYNPSSGYIVSANNRPVVTNPTIGYFFSANDRVDRISKLISDKTPVDFDDLKVIQQDTYVESAYRLHGKLMQKINLLADATWTDMEKSYLETLKQWDGYYDKKSKGALAFQLLCYYFASDYYAQRYDETVRDMLLSSEFLNTFLLEDLDNEWSGIIKPRLINSISEAATQCDKYENWGDFHRLNVAHPLGMIPIIGKKFKFGNYPIGGTYNSAMKTAHNVTDQRHNSFYGANSRLITKLDDPNENYFVLLGGQDGWIGSDHIVDQVPLWLQGDYIKFPMMKNAVQAAFPFVLKLTPSEADQE
ncbi:penicillin acylase family protein [candidate division KSB1 bacterium]|nr:penicillin acylase family protein [candidate division KSB1 bacterium]